ncbi:MAG TPA: hypothetical protein ENI23_08005 [bacterium]|nr:hypothetical protein [bacterium]
MKKLEPNLSSIFSEIKSLIDPEILNNHPYFKDGSLPEFHTLMESLLESFSQDFIDIYKINLEFPPLKEKSFREGWIKNWINKYFGIS